MKDMGSFAGNFFQNIFKRLKNSQKFFKEAKKMFFKNSNKFQSLKFLSNFCNTLKALYLSFYPYIPKINSFFIQYFVSLNFSLSYFFNHIMSLILNLCSRERKINGIKINNLCNK